MDAEPVLVSACLLGVDCTYRGGNERREALLEALRGVPVVPVGPEAAGGLGIPRPRCEVGGGDGGAVLDGHAGVRTADGEDHTEAYLAGARVAVEVARRHGVRLAVLKDRSP